MSWVKPKKMSHIGLKSQPQDISEFINSRIGQKKFSSYQNAGVFNADYVNQLQHIKTIIKDYNVILEYNKKDVRIQIKIGANALKENMDLYSFDFDLFLSVKLPNYSRYFYDVIFLDCRIKPKKTKAKYRNGFLYITAEKTWFW